MSRGAAATVGHTRVPRTVRAAKKALAKPALTIVDAIQDPQIFAPWFRDAQTWMAWVRCSQGYVRPAARRCRD